MVDAGQQNQRVRIEDGRLCDVTTAGRAVSHSWLVERKTNVDKVGGDVLPKANRRDFVMIRASLAVWGVSLREVIPQAVKSATLDLEGSRKQSEALVVLASCCQRPVTSISASERSAIVTAVTNGLRRECVPSLKHGA